MASARIVEFYEISDTKSVLDEIEDDLTTVQMVRFQKNVLRLEKYGWDLDGAYFDNVAGSKSGLREYRLTLDKVDYRVLFTEESGPMFLMLVGYKETRGGVPSSKIKTAESRLKTWNARIAAQNSKNSDKKRDL